MSIDPYLAFEIAQTAIQLAPKIADAAQKLWSKTKKSEPAKSALSGSDDAEGANSNPVISIEARALIAESRIHDLQSEMQAATELIKELADQNAEFAKYIEASRFQFESIEKQNSLLFQRVESDSELLKGFESYSRRLAKDIEAERLRVHRLTGICIAVGVLAVAGVAMGVRLSLQ